MNIAELGCNPGGEHASAFPDAFGSCQNTLNAWNAVEKWSDGEKTSGLPI